jgi:predicted  nucleic acid-binding Zn-ribbon protein
MNELLSNLLKLQALEFNETDEENTEPKIAELKAKIPQPILGHYERLVARGKKGVALVRNQVCTGCHMRLPIGTINTLMQGQDIQLCDTCGRYLALATPEETPTAETETGNKPAPKRAVRPRKRKPLATNPI